MPTHYVALVLSALPLTALAIYILYHALDPPRTWYNAQELVQAIISNKQR